MVVLSIVGVITERFVTEGLDYIEKDLLAPAFAKAVRALVLIFLLVVIFLLGAPKAAHRPEPGEESPKRAVPLPLVVAAGVLLGVAAAVGRGFFF